MIVKMFKPQFAPLVESGRKLQTMRPIPKRMPIAGDEISLRTWTDKPYRSPQRILANGIIDGVHVVEVHEDSLIFDGRQIGHGMRDAFAKADGFENFEAMIRWFDNEHGLPFRGIAIFWKLSNPNNQ